MLRPQLQYIPLFGGYIPASLLGGSWLLVGGVDAMLQIVLVLLHSVLLRTHYRPHSSLGRSYPSLIVRNNIWTGHSSLVIVSPTDSFSLVLSTPFLTFSSTDNLVIIRSTLLFFFFCPWSDLLTAINVPRLGLLWRLGCFWDGRWLVLRAFALAGGDTLASSSFNLFEWKLFLPDSFWIVLFVLLSLGVDGWTVSAVSWLKLIVLFLPNHNPGLIRFPTSPPSAIFHSSISLY